jgi:hypothetical protein
MPCVALAAISLQIAKQEWVTSNTFVGCCRYIGDCGAGRHRLFGFWSARGGSGLATWVNALNGWLGAGERLDVVRTVSISSYSPSWITIRCTPRRSHATTYLPFHLKHHARTFTIIGEKYFLTPRPSPF